MTLLILLLICPIVCAIVASGKHRSGFGWFIIGCILQLLGVIMVLIVGDGRPQTVIIQQNNTIEPPANGDMSKWSALDRQRYERQRAAAPRTIEAQPVALEPPRQTSLAPRDPRELMSPVTALKMLAEAGSGGLDDHAVETILNYIEVESAGIQYTEAQASKVAEWVRSIPSNDEAIRQATKTLKTSVGQPDRFIDAMTMVCGFSPSDLQNRWVAALRRVVAA